MGQADVLKFRTLRVSTLAGDVLNPPFNGGPGVGTDPLFFMSPIAPSGMPTTGFVFALQAPAATPATPPAGGFSVVVWFRDPNTFRWAASAAATVDYRQMWVCNDLDAIDGVFFQFATLGVDGLIDIQFAEQ